jgi:hypothetical protein
MMFRPRLVKMLCALLVVAVVSPAPARAYSASSPWSQVKVSAAHSRSVWATTSTGAALSFTVKGKSFAMWFTAGPKNGRAAVFINGKRSRIVDQYAPRTIRRR